MEGIREGPRSYPPEAFSSHDNLSALIRGFGNERAPAGCLYETRRSEIEVSGRAIARFFRALGTRSSVIETPSARRDQLRHDLVDGTCPIGPAFLRRTVQVPGGTQDDTA
jgi:hypothetical protein